MVKERIAGFDETGPLRPDDDPFADTASSRQAERIGHAAHEERQSSEISRRANDAVVDRKLTSLHRHGLDLQERIGELTGVAEKLAAKIGQVDTRLGGMETSQAKNNEMTEKILLLMSGGKFIVGMIKFFGVIAVPITAIYTLWYVIKHGGQPPGLP